MKSPFAIIALVVAGLLLGLGLGTLIGRQPPADLGRMEALVRDSITYEQDRIKWIDFSQGQRDTILQYKQRDLLLSAQHDKADEARRNRPPTRSTDSDSLRAAILKEQGIIQHQ